MNRKKNKIQKQNDLVYLFIIFNVGNIFTFILMAIAVVVVGGGGENLFLDNSDSSTQ